MFKNKGFSLLELLLVVGILAAIFSFSAPFLLDFYTNQLTGDTQSNIIDALQRARHNAVLQKNDSNFGVHIVAGSYIIFQTPDLTYTNRVSAQDEIFPVVNKINFTGPANIIFSKFTGLPSATGTIILNYGSIAKGVTIDNTGSISKASTLPVGGLAVSDGLISYWSFDGNATDSVGSNNGTVNGATLTSGIKGLLNTAYSFNGSSSYINMNNPIGCGNVDFSISLWANAFVLDSTYDGLITTQNGGDSAWYVMRDAGHNYFTTGYNSNYLIYPSVSTNTWHNYLFTKKGNILSIYFDGVFYNSTNAGYTCTGDSAQIWLGTYRTSAQHFLNGSMDNVRIYNRALTADEVTTIYNSEKP